MSKRRSLVRCVSTTLCVGLLSGVVAFGAPKVKDPPAPPPPPPPPPVAAEYTVVDLHWNPDYGVSMNEAGQTVASFVDWFEVQDASGITVVAAPDESTFISESLNLAADQQLVTAFAGRTEIGAAGVVMGVLKARIYSNGVPVGWEFHRPYVAEPDADGGYTFTDLGLVIPYPNGDSANSANFTVQPYFYRASENGALVGLAAVTERVFDPVTGKYLSSTTSAAPIRIAPVMTPEGFNWYVDGPDGTNALTEVLAEWRAWTDGIEPIAVDEAGGAYLRDSDDESSYVALPDCESLLPLGSAADKFHPNWARSSTGIVVGGVDIKKPNETYWRFTPAYVQPKTVNGEFVWYEPRRDGTNALLVKLGLLTGYTNNCSAQAVNRQGQIVGRGSSTSATRALLWKNGVAVDLNTLVAPSAGVVLTSADRINDKGMILCKGTGANGASYFLLVPIAAAD